MQDVHKATSANRLGELLTKRHVRMVHVAAYCDVDQSTVWRWAQGHSSIPDDQKRRLAEYFGVSRAYLMGWDEDPNSGEPAPEAA